MTRHRNEGLRKLCGCPRRNWPKCSHSWHFNFKWDGTPYRLSLDRYAGHRITSKTEAQSRADAIRSAIRAGTFRHKGRTTHLEQGALCFDDLTTTYLQRMRPTRRDARHRVNLRSMFRQLAAFKSAGQRLGSKPIKAITEDDFDLVLRSLRERRLAASTCNHYIQCVRTLSNWGVSKCYLTRPWIRPAEELRRDRESELRRQKGAQRNRRLRNGEEEALLGVSNPRLYRLIVAALETGCRLGELVLLRWQEVNLGRREVRILAHTAKDDEDRILSISGRLLAVLEMGQHDPTGYLLGPDAHVFGDEVGRFESSPFLVETLYGS